MEVVAASVAAIYFLLSKLKLVVEVASLSVVKTARETAGQISAPATSQVLPSESTHHVTLMTTN